MRLQNLRQKASAVCQKTSDAHQKASYVHQKASDGKHSTVEIVASMPRLSVQKNIRETPSPFTF